MGRHPRRWSRPRLAIAEPLRGDIWLVDLDPTRGHEQAGRRPAVVVSVDRFNHGAAGLVVALPITTRDRRIPLHVPIDAPEGGVRTRSFITCEDVRAISKERLSHRWGSVSSATLAAVEDRIHILLASDHRVARARYPRDRHHPSGDGGDHRVGVDD